MSEQDEIFASDAAATLAQENEITTEILREVDFEPSGTGGKYTKGDIESIIASRDEDEDEDEDEVADNVYTYVGQGADSPRKIYFMGKQHFIRGKATEVTDPTVLGKIENNPSFQKGEVDIEDLEDYDAEQREAEDAQRKEDAVVDAAFRKRHA